MLKQKQPDHKTYLNIGSRVGFLLYWIFDNIQILSKIKFLDGVDTAKAAKRAATFWLIALLFGLAVVLINMYETTQEEA